MQEQYLLGRLSELEKNKASLREFEKLKDTASKADIRVLFQDIKNIIVTYSNNIKNVSAM